MAGLSVLLETPKGLQKCTHIISKTSLMRYSSPSSLSLDSSSFSSSSTSSFLENCCFCRRKLQEGNDIYMYRGDRAFCSVECRCRQIFMDEQSGRRDHCSLAAAAAAGAAGGGARSGKGGRESARRRSR